MADFDNCVFADVEMTTIRADRDGREIFIPVDETNVDYAAIIANGLEVADYEPPPIDLKAYAANKRWAVEIGGTTWSDWPVATDREASQPKALAAFVAVNAGLRSDGETWKFADGVFRPLSNVEMIEVATAIFTHVTAAFAVEATVIAAIDAGTIDDAGQIDDAAWPGA